MPGVPIKRIASIVNSQRALVGTKRPREMRSGSQQMLTTCIRLTAGVQASEAGGSMRTVPAAGHGQLPGISPGHARAVGDQK